MTLLPWGLLAVVSVVLAVVFGTGIGVPRSRPSGVRGAVVRWAHAIVWVLMAAMFLALATGAAGASLVAPLGLLALATYVTFLVALFGSARR